MITHLPTFSDWDFTVLVPNLQVRLEENRLAIEAIVNNFEAPSWQNTMEPLQDLEESLSRWWAPVSHLHHVCQIEALKAVYEEALSLLSDYETQIGQHKGLYERLSVLWESKEFLSLAQKKALEDSLLAFRLSGVGLNEVERERFKQNEIALNTLSSRFDQNLIEATESWSFLIESKEELRGLPESTMVLIAERAREKGLNGWLLTLDAPTYQAAMLYLENRHLRQKLYEAYIVRASSDNGGDWNNEPILKEILERRQENARLLNFSNYAHMAVVDKMAKQPEKVSQFLENMVHRALQKAHQELEDLRAFVVLEEPDFPPLAPWDIPYWSERYKNHCYQIDEEALRDYFPLTKVISGLNEILQQLFGVSLERLEKAVDVWHPDVQVYVLKEGTETKGYLYADWLARPGKREGAWMDNPVYRIQMKEGIQMPVAFLVCNFRPALDGQPILLKHEEVVTLFHEMGHCLHHLLTEQSVWGVSGISGVPWDAVEFPSQFLEYWCWQKAVIPLISEHYQTQHPLPESCLEQLLASQHFQAGLSLCRQLVYSLFDFTIHQETAVEPKVLFHELQRAIGVLPISPQHCFPCHFGHIFVGGYAAAYYSYLWAEVLAADAFAFFDEKGIFNKELGLKFKEEILSQGGLKSPMDLFIGFRGREPKVESLFAYRGLNS